MKSRLLLKKYIFILSIFILSIAVRYNNIDYNNKLTYIVTIFITTFVIFFSYMYSNNKLNIFADVYFIYPFVFFMYSIFGPIYILVYNKPITYELGSGYDIVLESSYYYLYIFMILAGLVILFYTRKNITNINNKKVNYRLGRGVIFFDILAFLLVLFFIINILKNVGVSIFTLDKAVAVEKIGMYSNKVLIYGDLILVGYSFYISAATIQSYIRTKMIKYNYLRHTVILIYWLINLKLGIRRGFLFFLLISFVWMIAQKEIKKKKIMKYMGILIIILLILGMIREKVLYTQSSALFFKILGEFMLPQWITYFYILNPKPLSFGITYCYIFPYMFPKILMPNKPEELGMLFWKEANTNTALAFNPVAEGILNFGEYSIIFVPIIIFIIIYLARKTERKEIFYLVICGSVLNFTRGQFATWAFECLFVFLFIKIMNLVIRLCGEKYV